MKTAMEQLKEKLLLCGNIHNIETGVENPLVELKEIIKMIDAELPTEREQMTEAYNVGWSDRGGYTTIEDYYLEEDREGYLKKYNHLQ